MKPIIEQNPLREDIEALEQELREKKQQLATLRREVPAVPVKDYLVTDWNGNEVRLSDLFGDKEELIVVFNMGKSCVYCTLWADGLNGLTPHLEDRAMFILVSPDPPKVQKKFAKSRDWQFPMYSHNERPFALEMGFATESGQQLPGVAVFTKDENGKVYHRSSSTFGPGDNFNPMYDLMDLLPNGWNKWGPQYSYE